MRKVIETMLMFSLEGKSVFKTSDSITGKIYAAP